MPRAYERDEIEKFVDVMLTEMESEEWKNAVVARILQDPVPKTSEEMITRFEEEQADFFTRYQLTATGDPQSGSPISNNAVGKDILSQLQSAVLRFEDDSMEELITKLASSVEAQLTSISATYPQLKDVFVGEGPPPEDGAHGHSHGGQPCNHNHGHGGAGHSHGGQPCNHNHGHGGAGHSHGGQPCNHNHGHGGAGHSHGGQPCNHNHGHGGAGHSHAGMGPGGPPPQLMMAAMNSLSPQQKQTMQQIQQKMQRGQAPSGEEQIEMMQIQRHVMSFIETMQQFMGGSPAPAA